MPEPVTSLAALIGDSTERLRQAGIAEPRRQALRIWSELRGVSQAEALLGEHRAIPPSQAADFRHAILRRTAGEPVAYVTGWAGFRHLVLRSDQRALIPGWSWTWVPEPVASRSAWRRRETSSGWWVWTARAKRWRWRS